MIKIDKAFVEGVLSATAPEDLYVYLQNAIMLEHSTIPPYLTAMFSLKPGVNDKIAKLIRSVVIEEMLHLSIASNILIAIGGRPEINVPGFIPTYPNHLPMSIGGSTFKVGIEAFSIDLVRNIFMTIEEPEHPIDVRTMAAAEDLPTYKTIGAFYDAVKEKLTQFGDGVFKVGADQQMLTWFPADELFPIVDVASAKRGIDIIVEQGEGTRSDPFERPGDPAHFYKFGEIAAGHEIVQTPDGYAYGGAAILFDPAGVYPIKANCKIADFSRDSQAGEQIRQFAYSYSSLLNALHATFNGAPGNIDVVMGLMYELKVTATRLMTTPLPDQPALTVGPSFEYVETSVATRPLADA